MWSAPALRRVSASATVRLTRTSEATPRMNDCPGATVSRFVPSALIWSWTAFCAPLPSAIMVMTAPTPMMMPSIVRNERSLFARIAWSATFQISMNSTG